MQFTESLTNLAKNQTILTFLLVKYKGGGFLSNIKGTIKENGICDQEFLIFLREMRLRVGL
jgi:hypothetical protein